jgi:mannose-1-phosphate guanylyltransferase
VTLGIEVSRPATEYGYLIPDLEHGAVIHDLQAYPLEAFEEKPSVERAAELQRSPGVAWNAGMFLWRRRAIRAALADSPRHPRGDRNRPLLAPCRRVPDPVDPIDYG